VKSYSGFFTVNKTHNSNLFFWFFPALVSEAKLSDAPSTPLSAVSSPKSGKTDVPVLLWLQGGPGASSLYGLFVENGPLKVNKDGSVEMRNYTWNKDFAV